MIHEEYGEHNEWGDECDGHEWGEVDSVAGHEWGGFNECEHDDEMEPPYADFYHAD